MPEQTKNIKMNDVLKTLKRFQADVDVGVSSSRHI